MILYSINGNTPKEAKMINFPDGTLKIDIEEKEIKSVLFIWKFKSEAEFMQLAYMTGNIHDRYPAIDIQLYLPYLPNARMDRVHSETEVFTLKYFCKLINSLNFTKVMVLDVHSSVGAALLERCINLSPAPFISIARKTIGFDSENDYILFPDEGSCKRYTKYFSDCKNIGFGIKKRDWATGKILGFDIYGDAPTGKKVLIVDDICSYGGTVYHSAKKLKQLNCDEINVFFTHCENSIEMGELFKCGLINNVFTTDSLCTLPDNNILSKIDCLKGVV